MTAITPPARVKPARPWYRRKRYWALIILGLLIVWAVSTPPAADVAEVDAAPRAEAAAEPEVDPDPLGDVVVPEDDPEPEPQPEPAAADATEAEEQVSEALRDLEDQLGLEEGESCNAETGVAGPGEGAFERNDSGDLECVAQPEEQPEVTPGQAMALEAAQDYLDYAPFSRSGLIDQLEYEGYTTEDATYAVDNVRVNWKQQAALSAQDYLDMMPFSRSGLIEQLEHEGFTTKQATYGADQVGL